MILPPIVHLTSSFTPHRTYVLVRGYPERREGNRPIDPSTNPLLALSEKGGPSGPLGGEIDSNEISLPSRRDEFFPTNVLEHLSTRPALARLAREK